MRYFSREAMESNFTLDDLIWPSERQKLLDRLEDLCIRREEMEERDNPVTEGWGLSDEDLRYVLPKDLKTISESRPYAFTEEGLALAGIGEEKKKR